MTPENLLWTFPVCFPQARCHLCPPSRRPRPGGLARQPGLKNVPQHLSHICDLSQTQISLAKTLLTSTKPHVNPRASRT